MELTKIELKGENMLLIVDSGRAVAVNINGTQLFDVKLDKLDNLVSYYEEIIFLHKNIKKLKGE